MGQIRLDFFFQTRQYVAFTGYRRYDLHILFIRELSSHLTDMWSGAIEKISEAVCVLHRC